MSSSPKFFDYEAFSSKNLSGNKKLMSEAFDIVISKLNKGMPLLPHQTTDIIRINKLRKELLSLSNNENFVDHLVSIAYDEIDKNDGRPNPYFNQIDNIIRESNNLFPSSQITVIMNMVCSFDDGHVIPGIKKFSGDNPVLYAYMYQRIAEYNHSEIKKSMELTLFHCNNNKSAPAYIDCVLQREAIFRMEQKIKRTIAGYNAAFKVMKDFDSKNDIDLLKMESREREIRELTGDSSFDM